MRKLFHLVCALLLSAPCFPAITLVQSNAGGSVTQAGTTPFTATTSSVGFTSNTTAGNLLVCVTWVYNSATSGNSASGNNWAAANITTSGVTWTQVRTPFGYDDASPFPLNEGGHGIFYIANAPAISSSTLTTFAITNNSGSPHTFTAHLEFSFYEFSGIAASSPVDTVVIGNLTTPSSPNGTPSAGNITTTAANDLLFVVYTGQPGSNLTAGGSYTLGVNAAVAVVGQTQYRMNVASGTYATAFTGTVPFYGITATAFKGVAAGATSVSRHRGWVF